MEFIDQGRAVAGFEDLFGGGDQDYNKTGSSCGAILPKPPTDRPPVVDAGPEQKGQEGDVTLKGKARPAADP